MFVRRLVSALAVLLPVALMCHTTQASASAAALTIELRSTSAHNLSYSYRPSAPGTYVATIEGAVNGAEIDPTTCGATLGDAGTGTGTGTGGPRASLSDCAGLTITADLGAPGTDKAAITVSAEGRPLAYGQGTVVVTTEPDPDEPAGFIVIVLIIILVLIPLSAS